MFVILRSRRAGRERVDFVEGERGSDTSGDDIGTFGMMRKGSERGREGEIKRSRDHDKVLTILAPPNDRHTSRLHRPDYRLYKDCYGTSDRPHRVYHGLRRRRVYVWPPSQPLGSRPISTRRGVRLSKDRGDCGLCQQTKRLRHFPDPFPVICAAENRMCVSHLAHTPFLFSVHTHTLFNINLGAIREQSPRRLSTPFSCFPP